MHVVIATQIDELLVPFGCPHTTITPHPHLTLHQLCTLYRYAHSIILCISQKAYFSQQQYWAVRDYLSPVSSATPNPCAISTEQSFVGP